MKENLHLLDYWIIIRRRWLMVAAVTAISFIGVTVLTLRQPRVYRAATQVRVEMEQPDILFYPSVANYLPYDQNRFYRTQIKIFQSDPILEAVARELKLNETWFPGLADGVDAAVERLRANLKITPIEGSTIIIVAYEDQNPRRAARIANSVVEQFIRKRKVIRRENLDEAIDNMRSQLNLNRQKLEQSDAALRKFKQKNGITIIRDRTIGEDKLAEMSKAYLTAKTIRINKEVQFQQLKKLSPEERIPALVMMQDNRQFQNLRGMLDQAETNLAELNEKYLPGHPEIKESQAKITKIKEKLYRLGQGMVNALEADYKKALAEEKFLADALGESKLEDNLKDESRAEYLRLKRQMETNQEVLLTTQKRMEEAAMRESIPKIRIEVVEPARAPGAPIKPRVKFNLLLGLLSGLIGGVGLALFFDYLNQGFGSVEEARKHLKIPVLSIVPKNTPLFPSRDAESSDLDPYRILRANLSFCRSKQEMKTILITSTAMGEGKSFTTVNTAICMAKMGDKVLLVDPDFRRPNIHKLMELPNKLGLVDILAGRSSLSEVIQTRKEDWKDLDVITTGRDCELGINLLNTRNIKQFFENCRNNYDTIIIDSPQTMGISDTLYLAAAAEGTIMVIEHNRYPRSLIIQAKKQLEEAGANILGAVLNKVDLQSAGYYYKYYRYIEK
jgi:capsular exopolysaccharide synthesis family protein